MSDSEVPEEPQSEDEATGPSAMEALPEDCLLAVLRLLPTPDLLLARGVCRRWAHAALHPEVWPHRDLESGPEAVQNEYEEDWHYLEEPERPSRRRGRTRSALRLAPCARRIDLDGLLDLVAPNATDASACATTELALTLRTETEIDRAVFAIKSQVALGRLRSLSVKTERPAWLFSATQQGGSLLAELLRVQGLRELRVDYYVGHALSFDYDDGGNLEFLTPVGKLPEPPSGARGSVPAEAAPASLRTLHFRSANLGAQPHLEFLMRSHAATLAEVTLPWTLRKLDLQSAPSAAAFNAIPNLRRLDIPLPADLHLLDCPLLCELRLDGHGINFETVCNAEAFLRSAAGARLTSLTLCCWLPTTVNRLLSALAASGQARLTTLTLECPAEVTDPYSFKWPLLRVGT